MRSLMQVSCTVLTGTVIFFGIRYTCVKEAWSSYFPLGQEPVEVEDGSRDVGIILLFTLAVLETCPSSSCPLMGLNAFHPLQVPWVLTFLLTLGSLLTARSAFCSPQRALGHHSNFLLSNAFPPFSTKPRLSHLPEPCLGPPDFMNPSMSKAPLDLLIANVLDLPLSILNTHTCELYM